MHRLRSVIQRRNVVTASPDEMVYAVACTMTEAGVGAIPILDADKLVGIFSERDLMARVVVPGRDPRRTPVGEVMTGSVVIAELDEPVEDCIDKMKSRGCRHLPVLVEGRLIGVLSMRDLLRDEIEEQHLEIRSLRAYLHQTPL